MAYLLDTDVCIAAMRRNVNVVTRLSSCAPTDCIISSITAYELFTGVEKCAAPDVERHKVARLMEAVIVAPFDMEAARAAASIRAELERSGRIIGPYDLLLAGQAVANSLVLVTNNFDEFNRVAGLRLENWQANSNPPQ